MAHGNISGFFPVKSLLVHHLALFGLCNINCFCKPCAKF